VADVTIVWSAYMKHRCKLRGFDPALVEQIVRYSVERYRDEATGRLVVIGRHHDGLVVVPYEIAGDEVTPVTVHATTRQQISFRRKTGRFTDA